MYLKYKSDIKTTTTIIADDDPIIYDTTHDYGQDIIVKLRDEHINNVNINLTRLPYDMKQITFLTLAPMLNAVKTRPRPRHRNRHRHRT